MATTFVCVDCFDLGTYILEGKKSKVTLISKPFRFIVRLRMWYAKLRGHKGKRWDYEPSEHYMGWHKHDKHR